MGRKRRNNAKRYLFDNFYIDISIYKKTVVNFQLRFNFGRDSDSIEDISLLREKTKSMFKDEFSHIGRSRHIINIDMTDTMRERTAHCSLNAYFLLFDGYEDYVVERSKILMDKLVTLFKDNGMELILPLRANKYTKTY